MQSSPRSVKSRPSREPQRKRTGNRTLVACINCKQRKLRCDDQIPTCANCRRYGLMCLVEDPVTKRHQPRNYLEALEERVVLLEHVLQENRLDLAAVLPSPGDSQAPEFQDLPPTRGQLISNEQSSRLGASKTGEDEDGVSDLATKVGMLVLNAAGAEPHYLGSSSTFAFSRMINSSLLKTVQGRPNGNMRLDQDHGSIAAPCLLPDYESSVMLSNAYFQNIHPQYPFLHEPTFRLWEMRFAHPSELLDSLNLDPVPLFFLFMVYAIGALLLPRSGHSPEQLYASAQLYIDHVLSLDNLESIQAILCCAVYSLRSPTGTSVWRLTGLALRQCIELGYHRNSRRLGITANPLLIELRKRAFWCAWTIDCLTGIILGRPLGVSPQEIDCDYPMDIDDQYITDKGIYGTARSSPTDPPTGMTRAIHAMKLRHVWARIHNSLYSDAELSSLSHPTYQARTDHWRSEIENWRALTPPSEQHTGEVLSMFKSTFWFDLSYSHSILYLYRGQLTDTKGGVSDDVFFEVMNAAANLCRLYRCQYVGKSTTYTWGALHTLFQAGLTYLHCLWTSPAVREATRQDTVSNTCTDCTMVLVLIAAWHEAAAPYRDIFEALASRTMTMMVDKDRESWMLPDGTPQMGSLNPDDLTQWMTGIADAGMSDEVDRLLTGLVGEVPPRDLGSAS